jgi:Uncharacterized conserved domain (SAYSvFN)
MVRSANERTLVFYAGCAAWAGACVWLFWNELGVIAFVVSILLLIYWFGLRDQFDGEDDNGRSMSAYSVFNKGGKAMPGSLTGQQIDQQLRGGMTYNNNNNESSASSSDQPLTTTATATSTKPLTDSDKLKRRSAAALAADRRLQQQQQEQRQQLQLQSVKES